MNTQPHRNPSPPKQTAPWIKPFAAAWRARAYFILGVTFWILHNTLPTPQTGPDTEWWKVLLFKAVGSLDKVSYAILLAGLAYAVLSDAFDYIWNTSLKAEFAAATQSVTGIVGKGLSTFTSGLTDLSFEAVKVWVEGGRGSSEQTRAIGTTAFKAHLGPPHSTKDAFVEFVSDDVIANWGAERAQTWDNYTINSVLRRGSVPDHFEWEERKTYEVVCRARVGRLPLKLEASIKIEAARLRDVLDEMRFEIEFGTSKVMDFRAWWRNNEGAFRQEGFRIESEGHLLVYDSVWLLFEFSGECTISSERTYVTIFEKSYISDQDRCYAVALRHPTRRLRVDVSIEGPGWIVKPPVTSASLYEKGSKGVRIETPHSKTAAAVVNEWTLPGLAVMIEWAPESTS